MDACAVMRDELQPKMLWRNGEQQQADHNGPAHTGKQRLISTCNRKLHGKYANFTTEPDRQQLNKETDTKIIR